jgi:GT2 family glycosyltransferase
MFLRKDVLDNASGFDERFFMYAEDIDLSYRIQQAGYINYYFAETAIIHFKGESTKKDFQYVKLFYSAMSLFVQKHFGGKKSVFMIILIQSAIWLRGAISAIGNLFTRIPASKRMKVLTFFLTGDEKSMALLIKKLSFDGRIILEKEPDADYIIFCEGQTFSFKKIIETIQQPQTKRNYKFYAASSNSVIGSNQKLLAEIALA